MDLKFFCPRWGSENIPWKDFFSQCKDAGYDGVEYAIDRNVTEIQLHEVWNLAAKHNALLIAQHYDTSEADFDSHYKIYEAWLKRMLEFPSLKIDSQTGKDYFTFEQNKALIELASEYSAKSGIPLYHETHRNKFSFAAHITNEYLEKISTLKITLDASHWVCVAASYLEDQQEAINLAISRAEHIHARVGHPDAPQVNDPRAPEWQEAVNHHLQWWDKIIERKKKENGAISISPEFGPFPYMPTQPYTNTPLSDQWEVNVYMMNLLKKRYTSDRSY